MSETADRAGELADLLEGLERLVVELVGRELDRRLLPPAWLTLEEAAQRYRTTPAALRKRAQRGQLPGAVRDGSRWLLDAAVYDQALALGALAGHDQGKGSRRANGRAHGTGG